MKETLLYSATSRWWHQHHLFDGDGVKIPPSHYEVKVAIMRLKSNKAASHKLFKTDSNELERYMHQLIYKIWLEQIMTNDWNLNVLCPVLNMETKRDVTAAFSAIERESTKMGLTVNDVYVTKRSICYRQVEI